LREERIDITRILKGVVLTMLQESVSLTEVVLAVLTVSMIFGMVFMLVDLNKTGPTRTVMVAWAIVSSNVNYLDMMFKCVQLTTRREHCRI